MGVEDARPAGVFQPDQESKVFLHRFFLHPLLKKYGSYAKLSDEGKKMREQILMGISKKKIRVASMVQLYTSALKKMMGIAQAVEIEEGRGDKLPNGRLQFWQLFFFKTEYHYRIWEKEEFEAVILDRLVSGGTKKHSLAALNWVIKGVKLWLSSQEARDHFMKNRLVSQKHLPNVDMMVVVDHEIEHQRSKLVNILDNTQKSNLNGLFNDQIQAAKKRKDDFEALF